MNIDLCVKLYFCNMNSFLTDIAYYIEQHKLLSVRAKVVIGLSGGADSVALLIALHELGYECVPAHCNFMLRGNESERDERFVDALCRRLGLGLCKERYDTQAYARMQKISIEMAARELRYDFFERLRKEVNAEAIAVAHHRNDNVETILLNLIRGTGLRGLTGIHPRNGYVVRPFLQVDKRTLCAYLDHKGEQWVEDHTNWEDAYKRNKIRLKLLPLMRELNPSVEETIQRTAVTLAGVEAVYEDAVRAQLKELVQHRVDKQAVRINVLLEKTGFASLLYEWLRPYGFSPDQLRQIIDGLEKDGSARFDAKEWSVWRDRGELLLVRKKGIDSVHTLELGGHLLLSEGLALACEELSMDVLGDIPQNSEMACLDRDLLKFPLTVRRIQAGDRFYPLGMKGHRKLVSDYLTDLKISQVERQEQWVVCSEGEIVWVLGKRIDHRYALNKKTCRIVRLTMQHDS